MSLLAEAPVAVLDLETTGFEPSRGHVVLEVARIELQGDGLGVPWSTLVRAGRTVPAEASAVHGITDAMLVGAPPAADVARVLRAALDGRTLVFHNAAFDLPFLQTMMRSAGERPLWNPVIDTLGLARGFADLESHGLQALARYYRLPSETPHRALGDALTTARLLSILARRWTDERGVRSLAELAAASQDVLRQPRRVDTLARTPR